MGVDSELGTQNVSVYFVIFAGSYGETCDIAFCVSLVKRILVSVRISVNSVEFAVLIDVGDKIRSLNGSDVNLEVVS